MKRSRRYRPVNSSFAAVFDSHFHIARKWTVTHAGTPLALIFAAGILLGVLGMNFSNAQDQSVKRTGLLRVDLASVEGREAIAYIADLAPGAGISKHSSHGDEFVLHP